MPEMPKLILLTVDIQNVAVEIPDIDGPNERGLLRRVWFPLCSMQSTRAPKKSLKS